MPALKKTLTKQLYTWKAWHLYLRLKFKIFITKLYVFAIEKKSPKLCFRSFYMFLCGEKLSFTSNSIANAIILPRLNRNCKKKIKIF